MIHRTGDVFTTEAVFVGHGVNLQGVMGRGIAKTIREEFPKTYAAYRAACTEEALKMGESLFVKEERFTIVNMATQRFIGPDARYDAIFKAALGAAEEVVRLATEEGRTPILAIPQIGCGIGGLEWDKVETLLRSVEILNPGFQFEVWRFDSSAGK